MAFLEGIPTAFNITSKDGLTTTLDIAALVSAIVWPLVIAIILFAYRKQFPDLIKSISGRIKKIGVGGFSLELGEAKAYDPQWQNAPDSIDLRHHAAGSNIADSTAAAFYHQLVQLDHADYSVVDLGKGQEWLSSRLFILSIVLARAKQIKCIVFLETSATVRKKLVGITSPSKVRWLLSKKFPWLEPAFAEAYSNIFVQPDLSKIVSSSGQLGRMDPQSVGPQDTPVSINLLQNFIGIVQNDNYRTKNNAVHSGNLSRFFVEADWVDLTKDGVAEPKHEAAIWLNAEILEDILGPSLKLEYVKKNLEESIIKNVLALEQEFIPLVNEDRRFLSLLKRNLLLEEMVKQELINFDKD